MRCVYVGAWDVTPDNHRMLRLSFQREAQNGGPPTVQYGVQQAVDSAAAAPVYAPGGGYYDTMYGTIYEPPPYDAVPTAVGNAPPDYHQVSGKSPSPSSTTLPPLHFCASIAPEPEAAPEAAPPAYVDTVPSPPSENNNSAL